MPGDAQRRVLVTGVGAIIGYGVVRALRAGEVPVRIIGLDIYPHAVGQHWCDAFERSLPVADPRYTDFLMDAIARHGIELVIPAIEQDVSFLSRNRDRFAASGAALALNAASLIELSDDKWLMHGKLQEIGLPTIDTRIEGSFAELAASLGAPFLIKPRRSYASKGLARAEGPEDLAYHRRKLGGNFMAQKIVGDADSEFTASLFGYGDGTGSPKVVFQRWLAQDGSTVRAQVVDEPTLELQMDTLTRAFAPIGPTNFQFRRHDGRFYLLEVNARISSSTSLRQAFGMNEAAMCLAYYLDHERPGLDGIRRGTAVRFIEDLVSYERLTF